MSRSYFSLTTAPSGGRCSFPGSIAGVVFTGLCLGALPSDSLHAQAPEASTYPVDPAAAAGMAARAISQVRTVARCTTSGSNHGSSLIAG